MSLVTTHEDAIVVSWIERHVGEVRSVSRQGRWRPAWYVEATAKGEPVSLYVRGARGGRFPPLPLSYEAKVHRVFYEQGVKVPKLYGYIEELPAMVMERAPGRPNMATAESDAARERLRQQLADQMRKIHEVNPALIVAAGAPDPKDPHEVTLCHYRQAEQLYLSGDRAPSPDLEFVRGWIERNAPPCEKPPCVIAMDAGQFIFEGDEITAMLDFEFACVGDIHADFSALKTRDTFEAIGDLESFYRLYEERSGEHLDRRRIDFQNIPFMAYTPLEVAHELLYPDKTPDYYEYYRWHAYSVQAAVEDIARYTGLALAPYELPKPTRNRYAHLSSAIAASTLNVDAQGDFSQAMLEKIRMNAGYLAFREHFARVFEDEYIADVAGLTGTTATSEWDADVVLEAFVHGAGPESDAAILQVLYRKARRMMAPIEGAGGRGIGVGWN